MLFYPSNPSNLDFDKLSLGSYIFQGQVPEYLERDVDSILTDRIQNGDSKITFISGAPKSGKTRSLINFLEHNANPDSIVFWLKNHPKAIESFLSMLEYLPAGKSIFVLDDVQKFSPGVPGGLTLHALSLLEERGQVLGTVHDSFFELTTNGFDDRDRASLAKLDPDLMTLLKKNTIKVDGRLSENELKRAIRLYDLEREPHVGIENLGSYFSAGDTHLSKLNALRKGSSLERAVFSALVSCQIISFSGFDLEQVRILTWHFLSTRFPNVIWNESKWLDIIFDVTGGESEASVHSLLMRNPDDPKFFTLMDYVWELSFSSWESKSELLRNEIPDPKSIGVDPLDAAVSALQLDFSHWAEEFLSGYMDFRLPISTENSFEEAEDHIPAQAVHAWAYLNHRHGKYDEALRAYSALIEFLETWTDILESVHTWHSYLEQILMKAECLENLSQKDEAISELEHIIELDPTYAPAYGELGRILRYGSDTDSAEYFIRTAVTLDPESIYFQMTLAQFLEFKSRSGSNKAKDESKAIHEKCLADPNLTEFQTLLCHQSLGHIAVEDEDYEVAKQHYEKALELRPDEEWPYLALSHVNKKLGNLQVARDLVLQLLSNEFWNSPQFFSTPVNYKHILKELIELEELLGNKEAIPRHMNKWKKWALASLDGYKWSLFDQDREAFEHLLEIEEQLGNKEQIEAHKRNRFEAQIKLLDEIFKDADQERLIDGNPHLKPSLEEYLRRLKSR